MDKSTVEVSRQPSKPRERPRPRQRTGLPTGGRQAGAERGVDLAAQDTTRESGPVTRTRGSDQSDLAMFIDRVIIPALVERFLAEHNVRRPDGDTPLAKPEDAA